MRKLASSLPPPPPPSKISSPTTSKVDLRLGLINSLQKNSKARFRRRSTHVPNLTEFGSTLERHWRDI